MLFSVTFLGFYFVVFATALPYIISELLSDGSTNVTKAQVLPVTCQASRQWIGPDFWYRDCFAAKIAFFNYTNGFHLHKMRSFYDRGDPAPDEKSFPLPLRVVSS